MRVGFVKNFFKTRNNVGRAKYRRITRRERVSGVGSSRHLQFAAIHPVNGVVGT